MLGRRLVIGTIMAFSLGLLSWLDYLIGEKTAHLGVLLAPFAILGAILAADEVRHMLAQIGGNSRRSVIVIGVFIIVFLSVAPGVFAIEYLGCHIGLLGWQLLGFAAAIGIAFVVEMIGYELSGKTIPSDMHGAAIKRIVESVFVFGYIGVLMSFLSALRFFHDNAWGLFAFLSVVLIVKFSDSCAYAVGKSFGTQKMAPALSPGKTIQGAIGAIVGGIGISIFLFFVVAPWITGSAGETSIVMAIVYGLVVTIAGMVGDLAESLLKRETNCKDSSSWLPGLGGVMDVLDSVLPAAPAAFIFWANSLVGP